MEFETIHQMYQHWFDTRASLVAYHLKIGGNWQPVTWKDFETKVTRFALGLMALGMEHRDSVTILSLTREEWDLADKAILSAGGVSVGCYTSNTPAQIRDVVQHSESRFLILEDRDQWEKVLQIRGELPLVKRFIIMDPEGAEGQGLIPFQDVIELGRQGDATLEEEYRRRFGSVSSEDTAIVCYASGTNGPPKGAMLSHGNVLEACRTMRDLQILSAQDVTVIWLPMPHVYGRIAQIAGACIGTSGYYAEGLDKVVDNLKEIRPTVFYSVPYILEKVYDRVMGEAEKASPAKRKVFRWALALGLARSRLLQEGRNPPLSLRMRYRLADAFLFSKVRDAFGGRIQIVISGGAPISKEILEFFHASGILPLELYGVTEALLCTMNVTNEYRFGSLGPPAPGVELRVAEDGELLARSGMLFKGYLKDEEKTRQAFTEDGWLSTGVMGVIDPDGFVWITDRRKDGDLLASMVDSFTDSPSE
jgi:long-chain acyl-CoA synthetase